jgi:DNA helicase-2/ATP-dependent DNA helicase PcrA
MLRLILDRTGYAKMLESEATPESEARRENLGELLNAAADAAARGESSEAFLDHAALVSDQDDYDPRATVQLMSLHAAKGLEFDVVFLAGLEEGLFPHSRSANSPAELEEERRLCYVGMTRARRHLALSHAARRRRFGGQGYEPTVPSRFLSEVPPDLLHDLSPADPLARRLAAGPRYVREGYSQEEGVKPARPGFRHTYNSVESIHQFFQRPGRNADAGGGGERSSNAVSPAAAGAKPASSPAVKSAAGGWRAGARVRHAKFGVGTVLRIEGEGEQTKLTISFPGFGLKKLLEKVAGLTTV